MCPPLSSTVNQNRAQIFIELTWVALLKSAWYTAGWDGVVILTLHDSFWQTLAALLLEIFVPVTRFMAITVLWCFLVEG